jgi:hypothetical protein
MAVWRTKIEEKMPQTAAGPTPDQITQQKSLQRAGGSKDGKDTLRSDFQANP